MPTLPAFTLPSAQAWMLAPQWLATMVVNLAYPLAAAALLALLVLAAARRFHLGAVPTLLLLALVPLPVALAAWLALQVVPTAIPPRPPHTALRLAHLNSLYWNNIPAPKVNFALASGADVVSLVEASPQVRESLRLAAAQYPYQAYSPIQNDSFHLRMLLLSKWPVEAIRNWGPRLQLYHIDRPGAPFYLLQVHPLSPSNPHATHTRNAQLATLAAARLPRPLIAVGDFNAANWDPHLHPLARQLTLPLLQLPTFPSIAPLTPIDHVLASPGIPAPRLRRIRVAATDHLGLVADFPRF